MPHPQADGAVKASTPKPAASPAPKVPDTKNAHTGVRVKSSRKGNPPAARLHAQAHARAHATPTPAPGSRARTSGRSPGSPGGRASALPQTGPRHEREAICRASDKAANGPRRAPGNREGLQARARGRGRLGEQKKPPSSRGDRTGHSGRSG